MEFCPKCGIMLTKKGDKYACAKCGYSKSNVTLSHIDKMPEKKKIVVVDANKEEGLPIIDAECAKCGHGKAYFWSKQTRGADESETCFFKCCKCGYSWRQYT